LFEEYGKFGFGFFVNVRTFCLVRWLMKKRERERKKNVGGGGPFIPAIEKIPNIFEILLESLGLSIVWVSIGKNNQNSQDTRELAGGSPNLRCFGLVFIVLNFAR
jgi:hypothetical protein